LSTSETILGDQVVGSTHLWKCEGTAISRGL